jgi:hypothetical protein
MSKSEIMIGVVYAMQAAEEIGGPEGSEYVDLMNKIIQLATTRRDTFLANQEE